MRFGIPLNLRRLGFAKALVAACLVNACASAAEFPNASANRDGPPLSLSAQESIEQCEGDLAVPDLDSIRSKADISRIAAEGPPPFRVALNDTFATKSERAVIAKWIAIWNHCRRREFPRIVPPPDHTIEAASLQQAFALSRIFQSSVSQLIRALYFQELTYGEFARKRYEFTRDAVALSSAINEAGHDPDQARLGQTLQQLLYLRLSWNTYLRRVNARQPGTVHIHGAIYT
jgi:hypothetical protein